MDLGGDALMLTVYVIFFSNACYCIQPYAASAKKDKARYAREMAKYTPPPPDDSDSDRQTKKRKK